VSVPVFTVVEYHIAPGSASSRNEHIAHFTILDRADESPTSHTFVIAIAFAAESRIIRISRSHADMPHVELYRVEG
jgi:hypothetical protein